MSYILLSRWVKVKIRTEDQALDGKRWEDIRGEVVPVTQIRSSPEKVAARYADQEDVYQVRWNWCHSNGEPKGAGGLQGHYHVGQAMVRAFPFLEVGMGSGG